MTEPLIRITSRAAVLDQPNIDTDIIFPARFLLLIDRDGMEHCLFRDRRFRADGTKDPLFPLNQDGLRDTRIIVAGPGFGCGSSREQAVWALVDYGIRVIIGTDFGDIFAGNAIKNGLLLIRLAPPNHAEAVLKAAAGGLFDVDLASLTIAIDGVDLCAIDIPDRAREALLNGWDETDLILNTEMDHITGFEDIHRKRQPWLFTAG